MRAIGKGSLASMLAVGLHIIRIIIGIGLIVFSIGAVMVPFLSIIVAGIESLPGINLEGSLDIDVSAGDYVGITYKFVTFAVMFFVVNRLLLILKSLRFGSPFVKENGEHFQKVGYALLIGEGAKFAFGFLSLIFGGDADIDITPIAWVAIMAVFVLGEVFREGARMKEEQDLTV